MGMKMKKLSATLYILLLISDVTAFILAFSSGSINAVIGFGLMLVFAIPLLPISLYSSGRSAVHGTLALLTLRAFLGVFIACMPLLRSVIQFHIVPLSILLGVDFLCGASMLLALPDRCYDGKQTGSRWIGLWPLAWLLFPLGFGIGALYYSLNFWINRGWGVEIISYLLDGILVFLMLALLPIVKKKKVLVSIAILFSCVSMSLGSIFALVRSWNDYFSNALIAAIPHLLIPFFLVGYVELLAYRDRIFTPKKPKSTPLPPSPSEVVR